MKLIKYPAKETWDEILSRPTIDNKQLLKQVGKILQDVKQKGDTAVKKYTKKFDGIALRKMQVDAKEIKKAEALISIELKQAIDQAYANILLFHNTQKETVKEVETMPGVHCWRKSIPLERVGLYIPGGTAPLFSTVLMLGVPAFVAGCKDVILCTPVSKEGSIHPAILYAASKIGVQTIYKIGGAQAIGAMAYGTTTIKKVHKIFGPGNQYVTAAKQLVQLEGTAIDMPAGPSEVCVIADATANPEYVAADLLSQAEHGVDSQVLLICNDAAMIEKVRKAVDTQLNLLPRKNIAQQALDNSKSILVSNMDEAMLISNQYAPEHLIIAADQAEVLAAQVVNAGSVFLGHYTPESAGDYASGTNHTLPTNGHARAYSGVSVDSFVKKVTFQQITKEGIQQVGPTVITMAEAEGLDAHANAVKIRIKK
ncbi:MAG: histidinol dehydrogenase [Chitinophagaceae bacterium]